MRPPLAVALAVAVLGVACAPIEPSLTLALTDRSITADRPSVPAGHQVLLIRNNGTVAHELEVIRTDAPADQLPLDPTLVKATAEGLVAERESIPAGATKRLSVDLEPGRYVLICNLPAHYAAGMRVALEVAECEIPAA